MPEFAELHCHTEYSNTHLIDSTNKLTAVIDHAIELGLRGLAITDHQCLSAHIKALSYYKSLKDKPEDFQLILGNEIYLCHNDTPDVTEEGKLVYHTESGQFYHFILLAKDDVGHSQLRQLSSRAWSRCYSYRGVERLPTYYSDIEEIVGNNKGHLIASTACLGGEFPKLVAQGNVEKCYSFVKWCQEQFGEENFYIELQPGVSDEQRFFNKRAVKFAKHFNIPWIITNDCHYLTADKRIVHENYLKSHEEEREAGDFYESTYFKTIGEMMLRMQDDLSEEEILQGFANTVTICESCKNAGDYHLFHSTIVPQREISHEPKLQHLLSQWYDVCPSLKFLSESPYMQDRFFLAECEKGIINKHVSICEEVAKRIDIEAEQLLGISDKLGCRLTSYYNLMQWIEDVIWEVSIIGPGRGSAGCLYCAYLMDITSVDSLKFGLPYWRHTHVSKVSLPDIDIDLCPSKRPLVFEMLKDRFGRDRCLNIITFKTETLKSAVKTAARGLGIDNDIAQELSNLVPITRGRVWTYQECLHGNADNGFAPLTELINKIHMYDGLEETILEIEGLISGRGSHASGFYMFSQPYLNQNSLMKTPSGQDVTCWEMEDSDACGALKFDLLVTDAMEKIQTALFQLADDGLIQKKETLKETYNTYIHPDTLDYTSSEMWDSVGASKVTDLFQFMTAMGTEAIKKIKPRSLNELATSSSVMRLMSDEDESPIDRYVRFRNDVNEWYKEMSECGLTTEEQQILKRHLSNDFGISAVQEVLMELTMDKQIAGLDMSGADFARKVIGKKQLDKIPKLKSMFYEGGEKCGARKPFLDYVWKWGIMSQAGYAFNLPHVLSYAEVALQQMNLYSKYPHIYWQCACLTANASANEENDDNKSTNYGKIASAIGAMKSQGVRFALPDINQAGFGFKPDAKEDQIIFGLKGMTGIGDDIARMIIANRPYTSLRDFLTKNPDIKTASLITLVKGGCFDKLASKPRQQIMEDLLLSLAEDEVPEKTSLNFQNFQSICNLNGFLPTKFSFAKRLVLFKGYAFKDKNKYSSKPKAYLMDKKSQLFFENELTKFFTEGTDYNYTDEGLVVIWAKFEKKYKEIISGMAEWLSSPETAKKYTQAMRQAYADDLYARYCDGTIPKWEMDSLSFYNSNHELNEKAEAKYGIDNFFALPETPVIVDVQTRKDKKTGTETSWNRYAINRIAGTVLDKNNTRHTITLLTTTGVVTVKFYAGNYAHYNKQISEVGADGKKTVVEKSWFARGNILMVSGYRRGDTFVPKTYHDSIYQNSVCMIKKISDTGTVELQLKREEGDNE